MAKRGEFTPYVANLMKDFLGRESSRAELRLLPYVMYVAQNDQVLEPARVNQEEREIMRLWKDAGYMEGGASGLAITQEFWQFANLIIWWAYVAFREQPVLETA